jgi:hypothetical protein
MLFSNFTLFLQSTIQLFSKGKMLNNHLYSGGEGEEGDDPFCPHILLPVPLALSQFL